MAMRKKSIRLEEDTCSSRGVLWGRFPRNLLRQLSPKLWLLTLLLLLAVLGGCSGNRYAQTLVTTPDVTKTTISFFAVTLIPTPVVGPPFRSFDQLARRCPRTLDSLSPGFLTRGTVFMIRPSDSYRGDLLMLTSQDEHPRVSDLPVWTVSPDGNWLVLWDWLYDDILTFISHDGQQRFSYTWNEEWISMWWLAGTDSVVAQIGREAAVDILEIPTGRMERFAPNLLDVYTYGREYSGWFVWKVVPDPTLTLFVYMRDVGEVIPALAIVERENNKTLWELRRFTPGDGTIAPVWSPDGQWLAISATDYFTVVNREIYGPIDEDATHLELFTVSRDGEAIQWLDVKQTDSVGHRVRMNELRWSPNGRYLAFVSGDNLCLLDMQVQQIYDLCVSRAEYVTWSPDSKQMIVKREDAPAVVIDLEKNIAAPLVDDLNIRPFGWLKAP